MKNKQARLHSATYQWVLNESTRTGESVHMVLVRIEEVNKRINGE